MLKMTKADQPTVSPMWCAVDPEYDSAILAIAQRLMPEGFDVCDHAPNTYEGVISEYQKHNRLCVWSGASDHTIYGSPSVNHAFRAWHDWCHCTGDYPFTLAGEASACSMQMQHIQDDYGDTETTRRWCAYILADVLGQSMFESVQSIFPKNQRYFVRRLVELLLEEQPDLPRQTYT